MTQFPGRRAAPYDPHLEVPGVAADARGEPEPGRGWLARLRVPAKRYRDRQWRQAEDRSRATTGRPKEQVQVCPRGCYFEQARPVGVAVTTGFGRADIRVDETFHA